MRGVCGCQSEASVRATWRGAVFRRCGRPIHPGRLGGARAACRARPHLGWRDEPLKWFHLPTGHQRSFRAAAPSSFFNARLSQKRTPPLMIISARPTALTRARAVPRVHGFRKPPSSHTLPTDSDDHIRVWELIARKRIHLHPDPRGELAARQINARLTHGDPLLLERTSRHPVRSRR